MTAESEAAGAALAELLALGMPSKPAQALSSVMVHGARTALALVADEQKRRAANPRPWATFHRIMAERLPRWRVFARAHHRRLSRKYRAMVDAGTATVEEER